MQTRRAIIRILIGTAADAVIAAICFWLHLNLATVTLLFVLSVVIQALGMAFASSISAALIAACFVDYLFIQPLFTWRISSFSDLIALTAFVVTALITSHLAASARKQAERAERRRKVLDRLYSLSERLLSVDVGDGVAHETLRTAVEIFGLRAACFFDGRTGEPVLVGDSVSLSSKTHEAYIHRADASYSDSGTVFICIREAGNMTGALGFEGFGDADLAARPLAALVMATINRARALRVAAMATAEAKAEVLRTAILDGLAHEFKTPLAVILAASGGLRESGSLTAVQRELTEEIENETVLLGELTTSLLNRKDTDYEQLDPNMEDLELDAFLASMVERLAHRHPDREVRFIRDAPGSIRASADEELLRLVVSQLLNNAAKYSGPGSPIAVSLMVIGNRIEVRIRNGGSSIPPAEQELVFQRFYRGSRHRYATAGSGLGLYVARRVAIAHGGTLSVEAATREDETTFLLTLPLMERNAQDAGVSPQSVGCR